MATLQDGGDDTYLYSSQSATQPDSQDSDEEPIDETAIQFDDDDVDVTPNEGEPLLFLWLWNNWRELSLWSH